jgi:surfactin synthase thioesterase subunit
MIPYFDVSFAFFGHSLGAKIAFELVRKIRRKIIFIRFISLLREVVPPHIPEPNPIHHLTEEKLIAKLSSYNATPKEVLQNKDLMKIYVPILRADFSIDEI